MEERKIPLTFESIVVSSPTEVKPITESNPNLYRIKVRVFSKYGNRNGSYITDQVAEQLIHSYLDNPVPVVGFYDPQSDSWAGHVGADLANIYGYVESFIDWEPFKDTDGITRDYAVFSVVLFTNYNKAARKILGCNQSMELNPDTIDGDWADIDGTEYFIFTKAQLFSCCVIGTKEPCFSVSAFFEKNNTQYEKLQNLVFEMRKIVDECQHGGDATMENENIEQAVVEEVTPVTDMNLAEEAAVEEQPAVEETPVVEEAPAAEPEAAENFAAEEEHVEEQPAEEPEAAFEAPIEETAEVAAEVVAEPESEAVVEEQPAEEAEAVAEPAQDFELLYNNLMAEYNALTESLNAANARIAELESANSTAVEEYTATINNLNEQISAANTRISGYEHAEFEAVQARKNELIASYEENLKEDEISEIRAQSSDLSYDELESKLAICFAHRQLHRDTEAVKVPTMTPENSEFANFMARYKKN